jgi:hypothetical protein
MLAEAVEPSCHVARKHPKVIDQVRVSADQFFEAMDGYAHG